MSHDYANQQATEIEDQLILPSKPTKPILPSKPLCEECFQVVLKAPTVNLSFVDVRANNTSHPHKGATDEQGNSTGYVYDVTRLRRNPPQFSLQGQELEVECAKNNDTEFKAVERLFVDKNEATDTDHTGSSPRILCAIYGMDKKRKNINAIRETWAPKCNGFFVASSKTDPSFDSVHIMQLHPDQYTNMWQKIRSMWSYIYDNYYDDFDWFHLGGDDMWLIVENLRDYLGSEEIRTAANGGLYIPQGRNKTQIPIYLGSRWKDWKDDDGVYNTGGPGAYFS
jgi:glycoprotein-N-acetylgalactosamine 3-beta-galactosyltransferase